MTRRSRWTVVSVITLWLAACASDDAKKKDPAEPKPTSTGARTEQLCEAECARSKRCDEGDEETDVERCLQTCRRDRLPHMHVLRPSFVFAYSACLQGLGCKKDASRCREAAIALAMEDPDDKEKRLAAEDEAGEGGGGGGGGDGKKKVDKKKANPKKAPTKLDAVLEKKKQRDAKAAEVARTIYQRCHARRLSCDATWSDRCDLAVALTDGGRDRVRVCLARPCEQVRGCLQDAVSW